MWSFQGWKDLGTAWLKRPPREESGFGVTASLSAGFLCQPSPFLEYKVLSPLKISHFLLFFIFSSIFSLKLGGKAPTKGISHKQRVTAAFLFPLKLEREAGNVQVGC